MADDILSIATEIDPSGAEAGASATANSIDNAGKRIRQSGDDMSQGMDYSMMEARHGVMLLGEEIGIRLPRAVSTMIASIAPIGAVMAAAFPILAIVMLIEVIDKAVDKFGKMKSAAEELQEATAKFDKEATDPVIKLNDQITKMDEKITGLKSGKIAELSAQIRDLGQAAGGAAAAKDIEALAKSLGDVFDKADPSTYQKFEHMIGDMWHKVATAGQNANVKEDTQQFLKDLAHEVDIGSTGVTFGLEMLAKRQKEVVEQINAENFTHPDDKQYAADLMVEANALDKIKTLLEATNAERNKSKQLLQTEENKAIYEQELKMDELINKSKAQLLKQEEQNFKEESKISAERLSQQIKAELLASENALRADQQQLKGYEQMVDGEIKAIEQGDSMKAAAITNEFRHRQITGEQYLSELRDLYNSDVMALMNAINQKEDLVIMEAQNEAAMRGVILTRAEAMELAGYQRLEAQKLLLQNQYIARYRAADQAEANRQQQEAQRLANAISQPISGAFTSILSHQRSVVGAMEELWNHYAMVAIESMVQVGVQELIGMALHKTVAETEKLTDAKTAFHKTYAALSGIPIIGPVIAPIGAAAAFAAVMAFEQGGIVPQTAMAQVHKDEMVLPADLSRGFQSMMSGGKQMGRGGGGITMHYSPTVHSMDQRGVKDVLDNHGREFVTFFYREMRKQNLI